MIKTQRMVMLQQKIIKLYRGDIIELPIDPCLFLTRSDIPSDVTTSELLIYMYFVIEKDKTIQLNDFLSRDLKLIDLMALAIYSRIYPINEQFIKLEKIYPCITQHAWFK